MKTEKILSRKAFTLIELLIVVAIIAILAAIAVPNFLEAQTRSKVARVKADQRTLATAIESYAVDFNRTMMGEAELKAAGLGISDYSLRAYAYRQLTTPVAYMTSIPSDPFYTPGNPDDWDPEASTDTALWGAKRFAYEYLDYKKFKGVARFPSVYYNGCLANGFTWYMVSNGPLGNIGDPSYAMYPLMAIRYAKTAAVPAGKPMSNLALYGGPERVNGWIYDPTNGTISCGLIHRTNQGILSTRGAFHVLYPQAWIP